MEINYVVSLGPSCFGSFQCKRQGIKKFSGPFDWVASNPNNLVHILEDDFKDFLDKSQYTEHAKNEQSRAGHSRYGEWFFCHFNPRISKEYGYYVRCVERFRKVLQKERVLYILHTRHNETVDADTLLNLLGPGAILFWCHHTVTGRPGCRIRQNGPRYFRIDMGLKSEWKYHLKFEHEIEQKRYDEIFNHLFKFKLEDCIEKNGDLFYEKRNVTDLTLT